MVRRVRTNHKPLHILVVIGILYTPFSRNMSMFPQLYDLSLLVSSDHYCPVGQESGQDRTLSWISAFQIISHSFTSFV